MNYKISDIVMALSSEITPANMSLDDTLTGADFGTALTLYPSVDFTLTDGAIWATFEMMEVWVPTKDIKIAFDYNLNATDNAKTVRMNVKTWATDSAETPSVTQDASYNEDITSGAGNTNKLTVLTCATAKVALAGLTSSTKYITIKIARDNTVGSNYGGTFQLMAIKAFQ